MEMSSRVWADWRDLCKKTDDVWKLSQMKSENIKTIMGLGLSLACSHQLKMKISERRIIKSGTNLIASIRKSVWALRERWSATVWVPLNKPHQPGSCEHEHNEHFRTDPSAQREASPPSPHTQPTPPPLPQEILPLLWCSSSALILEIRMQSGGSRTHFGLKASPVNTNEEMIQMFGQQPSCAYTEEQLGHPTVKLQ